MEELSLQAKELQRFIFDKPEVVKAILERNGYKMSNKVTLDEITQKTYKAIFSGNQKFIDNVDNAMANDGENSVVAMAAIGIAVSIAGIFSASAAAKKQRELQTKIVLAELENSKLIAEEQIRVQGETARTEILANSLTEYRIALQGESTSREKNVAIYLGVIGVVIMGMYGTVLMFKE
jgi:hypothetical protein